MAQAKKGDKVKVHYTGKLDDGTVFDSSAGREPLEFTLGGGQMIPGFDKAVETMSVGESKTIRISPKEGYGRRDEKRVLRVPRTQLPEGFEPQVGDQMQIQPPGGRPMMVKVIQVSERQVTMDGNHPLAGQSLTFEIQLVEIA
jgi:peptidylprolyl isomerase